SSGGAPYSNLVNTLTPTVIQYGTQTGFNWHPFGLSAFGADVTGSIQVATAGNYTFTLSSDDGSLLFIDGKQVVGNGGAHGSGNVTGSTTLTAGVHSFEVQFFENGLGASGLDLNLPSGVTYTTSSPAPTP